MNEKICNLCKKTKGLDEFYNNKKHNDGKSYKCKLCVKSYISDRMGEYLRGR